VSAGRFLFRIPNRRGLGHLMRGLNIARELRGLAPSADIRFHVRAVPPAELWNMDFSYEVEPADAGPEAWAQALAAYAPAVALYDTLLPKAGEWEGEPEGFRRAYIMRKWKDDKQAEVFEHPLLRRMDAVIVPHTPEEFGAELPGWLVARTVFVGPIVRLADPAAQERLKARYGVAPGDFLLTSSVGGGGFAEQADAFFRTVGAVHRAIGPSLPRLRHVVVKGPNYGKPLEALPGMTVVDTEPQLVDLLAASDLVIAEGGYNTVNEIRATRTPAIFLPSSRGKDDQEGRVRDLEARGLGRVFAEPADAAGVAEAILALVRGDGLAEIRRRYREDRVDVGNRRAAETILGLA
jgi:predicted glycosyltransferase